MLRKYSRSVKKIRGVNLEADYRASASNKTWLEHSDF
jgi:hypothetical protein